MDFCDLLPPAFQCETTIFIWKGGFYVFPTKSFKNHYHHLYDKNINQNLFLKLVF